MMLTRRIYLILLPLLVFTAALTAQPIDFTSLPADNQLVPRNIATNTATVSVAGTVTDATVDTVIVRHYEDDALVDSLVIDVTGDKSVSYEAEIAAAKVAHRFTVAVVRTTGETLVESATAENVVAGDVYVIQGQSNAVAKEYDGSAAENESNWIRSFGTSDPDPATSDADREWHLAEGDSQYQPGSVGQIGIRLARNIVDAYDLPVAVLNGAEGAQAIAHFLRNDSDPDDQTTNYGRLLTRAQRADVADEIRAVIWYQGEHDGTNDDNTPPAIYRDRFSQLRSDWQENFSGFDKIYVFQIRDGCGAPSPELRDMQRQLADNWNNVEVMSTTGLDGHYLDNPAINFWCHWSYEQGYKQLADRVYGQIRRDLYGSSVTAGIDPPNPSEVYFSRTSRDEITVEMRESDPLAMEAGAHELFSVSDGSVTVEAGTVEDNRVVLTLSGTASEVAELTYADIRGVWPWITNSNGTGLLTFVLPISVRTDLPPDPPVLSSPADGESNLISPVALTWEASISATKYKVQVATDAGFNNRELDQSNYPNTSIEFATSSSGDFFWRVQACDDANGCGDWSDTFTFTVVAEPAAPALVLPTDETENLTPDVTLEWAAVDQAVAYRVQISDTETFDSFIVNEGGLESLTYSTTLETGDYYWRVRAGNAAGSGPWSEVWSFSVLGPPAKPVLLTPDDGAEDLPGQLTLLWSEAENATSYKVQVASDAEFANLVVNESEVAAAQLQVTLDTGPYFWRVRSVNPNGQSGWSTVFSFSVLNVPNQVTLDSPADGAESLPDTLTLVWSGVTTADAYQLQVARDALFDSVLVDVSDLTETSYEVAGLETATYFWRVRATNETGFSPWSPTFRFSVLATPAMPVLTDPADGEAGLPESITLKWDPAEDAARYDVQVASDAVFDTLLYDVLGMDQTELAAGPFDFGTYYWRVRGRNSNGPGPWSEVSTFIRVTRPAVPDLLSPENGASGLISEPVLEWEAIPFATSYALTVATDESFQSSIVFTAPFLFENTLKIGPLDIGTTYYWRVQARNATGASGWSETWSFSVRNTTDVERDGDVIPAEFALRPAYPNPFNPGTAIPFALPERTSVELSILDMSGKVVEVLLSKELPAGEYRASWRADGLASGVYIVHLRAGSFSESGKLILMK